MSTEKELISMFKDIIKQRSDAEAFLAMSKEQRIAFVRNQIANGEFEKDQTLTIREMIELASIYGDFEQPYYRYRMAIEARDPAVVQAEMRSSNDARYFLESYGVERAMPYLSNRLWLEAYHYGATPEIGQVIKSRGAEHIAEEIQKPAETVSSRQIDIIVLGRHFIEIFGVDATSLLPKSLAVTLKGRHLEDELGL